MVEAASPARLVIGDTDIRLFDEAVYTGDPGTDNLAFILFRDGIRELLLYEGVSATSLRSWSMHWPTWMPSNAGTTTWSLSSGKPIYPTSTMSLRIPWWEAPK